MRWRRRPGSLAQIPPDDHPSKATVREVLRWLADDGWYVVRIRGSHRQLKHPVRPGRVTVAGQLSDMLARKTLNGILKQAGLKP